VGIVIAGILAAVFNVALNTFFFMWLGLTIGMGLAAWIVVDRLSSRFPALQEEEQSADVPLE